MKRLAPTITPDGRPYGYERRRHGEVERGNRDGGPLHRATSPPAALLSINFTLISASDGPGCLFLFGPCIRNIAQSSADPRRSRSLEQCAPPSRHDNAAPPHRTVASDHQLRTIQVQAITESHAASLLNEPYIQRAIYSESPRILPTPESLLMWSDFILSLAASYSAHSSNGASRTPPARSCACGSESAPSCSPGERM